MLLKCSTLFARTCRRVRATLGAREDSEEDLAAVHREAEARPAAGSEIHDALSQVRKIVSKAKNDQKHENRCGHVLDLQRRLVRCERIERRVAGGQRELRFQIVLPAK